MTTIQGLYGLVSGIQIRGCFPMHLSFLGVVAMVILKVGVAAMGQ